MFDDKEYFKVVAAQSDCNLEKYREMSGDLREFPIPSAYETLGDYLNAAAAFYSEMIYSQQ